jgi:hypothetical protein
MVLEKIWKIKCEGILKRFFQTGLFKLTILTIILFVLAKCSPNVVTKSPDYPRSIGSNNSNQFPPDKKINILLLPVSDSRNLPPNYVGRNDARLVYYTETVSIIVRKAIQTELTNYGYDVLLCDEIKDRSPQEDKVFYLKASIQEFLADWEVKTFHSVKPISITLNTSLIDSKGTVIARNQFNDMIRRVSVMGGPKIATADAKKHCSYLISDVLPRVLDKMMLWINDNLTMDHKGKNVKKKIYEEKIVNKLEQLKEMRDKELITEEEYQIKRKEILKSF